MKQPFSFAALILCLLLAVSDSPAGNRGILLPDITAKSKFSSLYRASYALVVGNGSYTNGWHPLPGALQDVQEVAAILEKQGFAVTLKTNLTKSKFDSVFADFVYTQGRDPDDRLLFYYAGHGYTREMTTGEQLGYLVMVDAPEAEDFRSFSLHSVDMVSIVTQAKMIEAKHVLFMFDSCFSGTVLNQRNSISLSAISESISQPVRQFITAGSANEPVPDYSVFKQSFLDLLEGRDAEPIPDGFLTGEELGLYLKTKVPLYNPTQHPQYGRIRDPKLDKGDFVFRLANSSRPTGRPLLLGARSTLTVESNVPDADVYLDNKYIGKAKSASLTLLPGEHQILVAKEGYASCEKQVTIEAGRNYILIQLSENAPAKRITNDTGMVFVYIPPGEFQMGSPHDEPDRDDDERQHSVIIEKGYYLQETEVTQRQWRAVMGSNPSAFKACGDDCPVENVSWFDAQRFIQRLNDREGGGIYRLPTEAEWEYAARSGTDTAYSWGGGIDCSKALYANDRGSKDDSCVASVQRRGLAPDSTVPVKSYAPNGWGLYDMHGNIWEWCQDWKGEYPPGAVTDPAGPVDGKDRVLRGGCWDNSPRGLRSAYRGYNSPDSRYSLIGFRLLRTP